MVDQHQLDAAIFDTVANLIVVLDIDGRIVRFNRACEKTTGYSQDEVLGQTVWNLFVPADQRDGVERVFAELCVGHFPSEYENDWITRHGRRTIAWSNTVLLKDRKVEYVVGTGLDVTDRRESERRLRDSEQRYRNIVETAREGIWIIDQVGNTTYANRRMAEMLGYEVHEMAGRPMYDFVAPEWHDVARANLGRRQKGVTEDHELCLRRKDGAPLWTLASATPMFDAGGRFEGSLGMLADISAQKRAEAEAREVEQRLEFALAAANMFAWEWDPATDRLTQRGSTELFGRPPRSRGEFMQTVHPEDAPAVAALIDELLARPGPLNAEFRINRPDGQVRWVRDRGAMEVGPDGKPVRLVGVSVDVTDRKRVEQDLWQMNQTLERRVIERTAEFERQGRMFKLILDNMGDGVVVADRTGRFLLFNPAAERMIGPNPSEVPLAQWPEYFGFYMPDRKTPYLHENLPLRRAMRGESVDDVEVFIRRPGKSEGRWISVTARPVRDEQGQVVGGVTVLRDLAERKAAEEALRLSETRLRLLVEQAPVSIQTFLPDGRIQSVNRAWEKLFGVTQRDIPHYNILEDQQLVERGIMPMIRCAFGRQPATIPAIPYVPDRGALEGQPLWIRAHAYPVIDQQEQVREVVLIHEDISEQRRTEDQLRERERHYRELAERNRLLVQEVDHRVRNNLTALLGLISLVKEKMTDVRPFAQSIQSRIQGMVHVHQMLAETGWQAVQLRHLITSTLRMMQHLACHQIIETVEGPDVVIAPGRVSGLAMIVVEWFTNSCKYGAHSMPAGRLQITWAVEAEGKVRLRWSEHGGPSAARPITPSLGTELVHAFASRELSGHCATRFGSDGVDHTLEFQATISAHPDDRGTAATQPVSQS